MALDADWGAWGRDLPNTRYWPVGYFDMSGLSGYWVTSDGTMTVTLCQKPGGPQVGRPILAFWNIKSRWVGWEEGCGETCEAGHVEVFDPFDPEEGVTWNNFNEAIDFESGPWMIHTVTETDLSQLAPMTFTIPKEILQAWIYGPNTGFCFTNYPDHPDMTPNRGYWVYQKEYWLGSHPGSEYVPTLEFEAIPEAQSCAERWLGGTGLYADLDEDCYVDWSDFGLFAGDWQECNEPTDPECQPE